MSLAARIALFKPSLTQHANEIAHILTQSTGRLHSVPIFDGPVQAMVRSTAVDIFGPKFKLAYAGVGIPVHGGRTLESLCHAPHRWWKFQRSGCRLRIQWTTMEVLGAAVSVAFVAYFAVHGYNYLFSKPRSGDGVRLADADSDATPEELTSEYPVLQDIDGEGTAPFAEGEQEVEKDCGCMKCYAHAFADADAVTSECAGEKGEEPEDTETHDSAKPAMNTAPAGVELAAEVVPEGAQVPNGEQHCEAAPNASVGGVPRVKDASQRLEVQGSRGIHRERKHLYIKSLLAEVKSKYGTPKCEEYNVKAVHQFVYRRMLAQGLRPTHIAKHIHYVVQCSFVESPEELQAKLAARTLKLEYYERYEEHLSRVERWVRQASRACGFSIA